MSDMKSWQPISTAPKDGTSILVCAAGESSDLIQIALWSNGEWREASEHMPIDFTHWMPLPEPPKA